jgi:hypothetical protein
MVSGDLLSRAQNVPRRLRLRPRADLPVPAQAVLAAALGAVAIGALALGAVAIGRLVVGSARFRRLEVDELVVRKLMIEPVEDVDAGSPAS